MLKLRKKSLELEQENDVFFLILFPKIWEVRLYYLRKAIDMHIF